MHMALSKALFKCKKMLKSKYNGPYVQCTRKGSRLLVQDEINEWEIKVLIDSLCIFI